MIAFLILSVAIEARTQVSKKCDSRSQGILDLKDNFKDFYKDYDCFFQIFNRSEQLALSCKNQKDARDFLSLVSSIQGNAEVEAAFHKAAENLVKSNPKCFIVAAEKLNQGEQDYLLQVVKNPLFHNKTEIDKAIGNVKNDFKQSKFIAAYLK